MSKATTGLRRAGIGGLAAVVAAGTAIIGAGAASATLGSGGAFAATAAAPSGGTGTVTGAPLALYLPNSWAPGDQISFTVAAPGADCSTATATAGFDAASALTVGGFYTTTAGTTAGSTTDTAISLSAPAASASTACTALGVQTTWTYTVKSASTGTNTDFQLLTLNPKFDLGTGVGAGDVTVTVAGTNADTSSATIVPAGTETVTAYVVQLATLSTMPSSVQPASTANAMGNIVLAERKVGTVATGQVTVDLTNATFTSTSTPKVAVTAGDATITTAAAINTSTQLTFTVGQSVNTPSTFTISGVQVDAGSTAGALITVKTGGTAPAITATLGSIVTQGRIGGSDRYYTAAKLFDAAVGTNTATAVIANGYAYPDALSANVAVGSIDQAGSAGILLTGTNSLPPATAAALRTHNVTNVVVVGGTGVVSDAVVSAIEAISNAATVAAKQTGIIVTRIGGANRYATNELVNEFYGLGAAKTAIVATGQDFADALSVGPAVVSGNYNLVLTAPTALSPEASATFQNLGITNAIIVGGTGAVSSSVQTAIGGLGATVLARLAGADRYATAVQIATWETTGVIALDGTTKLALGWNGKDVAHLATGTTFADALAASAVAGPGMQVILLTTPTSLSSATGAYIKGLTSTSTLAKVNALGLGGAVSSSVLQAAANATVG